MQQAQMPMAYPMVQQAAAFRPGYSNPTSAPIIHMKVTPRDPGTVSQPYNFNIPVTVDAGYNAGKLDGA